MESSKNQQQSNQYQARDPNINYLVDHIPQLCADLHHGSSGTEYIKPVSVQYTHPAPLDSKMYALREIHKTMVEDKISLSNDQAFMSKIGDVFLGIKSCLMAQQLQQIQHGMASSGNAVSASMNSQNNNQVSDYVVEILLKANQVLFEFMPDIQNSQLIEQQMASMIPIFIENLGSPKAVVRKSTHKCIGTYVKLTKKLENVIANIIVTGLENSNSRTRQHSMLVIPALLSLKISIMERQCDEMKQLIKAVIRRIKSDQSEIVAKTGKKLILELNKCYPNTFKKQYIEGPASELDPVEKLICQAVLNNDDAMLKQAILNAQIQTDLQFSKKSQVKSQMVDKNDLRVVGKEILGNQNNMRASQSSEKEESKPIKDIAPNGLMYSFLKENLVEQLSENHSWKERTVAIETVEIELNKVLSATDKKMIFIPYATQFMVFMIQYIKDINFKICLTAIQITHKLLVLNIANAKKNYQLLVTTLIEKLSDSKVIIRQAVLKCCSLLIKDNTPILFSHHATKYLQHTNWHVREGILHLVANCLIMQSQQFELNGGDREDSSLSTSPTLIQELVHLMKYESKTKIQQMSVDCLALSIDTSQNNTKTETMIKRELNSGTDNQNAQNNFNQIKDRQTEECLPSMQIDGSIEFKPTEFTAPQYEQIPTFQEKPPLIAERPEVKDQASSSLNMRFQQDRLKSKAAIVVAPPTQQSQPKLKEQSVEKLKILDNTRQQYSLSTINHSENGHLQGIPKESNPNMTQQNIIPKVDTKINQQDFSGFAANNQKKEDNNPGSQLRSATIPKTHNQEELIHKNNDSDLKGQKTTNDEQKISMWLPSFQQSKGDSTKNVTSTDSISGQLFDKRQNQVKSSATLINDQNRNNMVSPITPGSVVSSQNQTIGLKLQRNHHEKPSMNVENQSQQAYVPGKHSYEPRQIQSNEVRQRTLENISFSQASPSPKNLNKLGGLTQKNEFISIQQSPLIPDNKSFKAGQVATNTVLSSSDIKQHQQRNMSQSSGAPGGFGVNKSQINERLQLLKSTFKYKNQSEAQEMQSQNVEEIKSVDNSIMQTKYKNQQFPKANSEYNARGLSSQKAALNNNNYMQQTRSGDSVQDNQHMMGNAQQTHNSFGLSNVSTNINNTSNNYNIKSYSANKQLQSTTAGSGYNFDRKDDSLNVYSNAQTKFNPQNSFNNSAAKGQFGGYGPVKATPIQQNEYMKTIQVEENMNNKQQNQVYQNNYGQNSATNNTSRTRKPPINASGQKQNNATPQIPPYNRANSVTSNDAFPPNANPQSTIGGTSNSATHYNAPEEPLANPEQQLKIAIDNLKSTDWQKNFDAMNIIKRVAMFHKPLLSMSKDPVTTKECIKGLVKQIDNLRSQVSKNACMAISTLYSELPSKDLEPQIDIIIPPLLKKATDTNHFISDQADNALVIICHACNESKMLNCLQSQNARSAVLKHKIAMCLTNLVSKLGAKIKAFRDADKLIKFIVNMLSEGAQEVRNQAKLAILTCRNGLATAREFDGLMLKSGLNDKQIEQVRKIVEQGDYESLSNFANTRYGGSMRGSSMDSRGGIDQRRTPNVIPRGNGSDGFAQSTFSDGNKMQSTFMSGGIPTQYQQQITTGTANGFGMTGTSNTAFKKRQPSVSKPVDPVLMEDFKTMINSCNTHDWQKRLQSIDTVNSWINDHSITVKQTQPSKFIQLVDIYCKFLSDNNAKVQNKALVNFKDFLLNDNLRQLIDQNLTMIVQTMSHNLASTSSQVRNTSDQLLELLEQTTDNRGQLVQPIVAQINLSNNRSKSQLIERLTGLIYNLQSSTQTNSIIDRYISPLLKSNNKIQNEASINPKLRESLKGLESAIMQVKTN